MSSHTKIEIACVVIAYFIVSILLVFSNKILLSSSGATIPAPLFVTWYQCALTAVIIYIFGKFSANANEQSWLKEFPTPHYKLDVARGVLPLSIIFVGMITFNNLCLKYVEVSFYSVARSLTIVINVIFSYLILNETTSKATLGCLVIVISGFIVGSDGEVNFSFIGTTFGVLSSAFVSLNAIYTKKVMSLVDNDKWRLAYYNNMNATIMFLPCMLLSGEFSIIYEYASLLYSLYFWLMMTIAGILGFAIGIVTVMQINYTSPLTHNISGTAKACVQTILALIIWQNPTTWKANLGVILVIFGSMIYAYVRMQEMNNNDKTPIVPVYQQVSSNNIDEDNSNNSKEDIELGKTNTIRT